MNFTQHKMFIGAVKSGVGAVTGVILANFVDITNPILSWPWAKHILIVCGFVLVVTESRYWNQWANSGVEQPLPVTLGKAQDLAQKTEAAISKAQDAAPKP